MEYLVIMENIYNVDASKSIANKLFGQQCLTTMFEKVEESNANDI